MFRRIRKILKPVEIPDRVVIEVIDQPIRTYQVPSGQSLLAALKSKGEDISSYCGGMCSCGTCIVEVVESSNIREPTSRERAVLGFSSEQSNQRLSCQLRLTGNIKIRLLQRF